MDSIAAIIQQSKTDNKRIGFVNGCFDCLHEGHIYLLKEARKYCDLLIAALNCDISVKALKGNSRPVDSLSLRMKKIIETKLVDSICAFHNETELLAFIKEIKPHVMIKGDDYFGSNITGAGYVQDHGGMVKLIPRLREFSTTAIIKDLV